MTALQLSALLGAVNTFVQWSEVNRYGSIKAYPLAEGCANECEMLAD